MNTSARLIIILTLTVSGVMAFASFLTLKQREASLSLAARDEVMAHAVTLQIALEEDLRVGRNLDAQKLINRLGLNSGIYGVLLFNENGEIEKVSDALKAKDIQDVNEARKVINDGKAIKHIRRLSGEDVFSIILPLRSGDKIAGAMEIAHEPDVLRTIAYVGASRAKSQLGIVMKRGAAGVLGNRAAKSLAKTKVL